MAAVAESRAREYVEYSKDALWYGMAEHAITPQILAFEIGVTESTVGRWLAGVRIPRDAMWRAIQRYFDTY